MDEFIELMSKIELFCETSILWMSNKVRGSQLFDIRKSEYSSKQQVFKKSWKLNQASGKARQNNQIYIMYQ